MMPLAVGMRTYREHQAFYDKLQKDVAHASDKSSEPDPDAVLAQLAVSPRLTAIANSNNGPVSQTQSSVNGGVLGTVNQDSSGVSTATTKQTEIQCEDAATGGRELGIDAGDAHRNRAFYIFDRSIPVAFEPGKNHNVERAVLVRSRIE